MEKHNKIHNKNSSDTIWMIATITLAVLLLLAIFTNGFREWSFGLEKNNIKTSATGFTVYVLNDERCTDCVMISEQVITQLKTIFPSMEIKEIDYSDKEGKKLFDESNLQYLPAFLFDEAAKTQENYAQIERYMVLQGDYNSLQVGAFFDPKAEICDNGKDDTGDGKTDCEEDSCKTQWQCVEKSDKPVVEMFVMSHCPYGTQIEKGMIPVVKLLGDKIDFQLKFVNYAMHGEKEVKEQLNQYCIGEEFPEKLIPYLECFLTEGDDAGCLEEMEITTEQLKECTTITDTKYDITKNLNDKSTWMGSFPPFNIYAQDNIKYGIKGSPGLIINGAEPSAGRDSKSLLEAICFAFDEQPSECSTEISSASPSPGFGWGTTASTTDASCG
jgi:hypothetical protein